jgi:hypothetical protein
VWWQMAQLLWPSMHVSILVGERKRGRGGRGGERERYRETDYAPMRSFQYFYLFAADITVGATAALNATITLANQTFLSVRNLFLKFMFIFITIIHSGI